MNDTHSPHQPMATDALAYLLALHRCGYLDTELLGIAVYHELNQDSVTLEPMVQGLTEQLLAQGLIISETRDKGKGQQALALRGARQLKQLTGNKNAVRGRNALKNANEHRFWTNRVVLHQMVKLGGIASNRVATEYEIQRGLAPLRVSSGKVPDFLFWRQHPDGRVLFDWGEVENSKRGGRDLKKLAQWMLNDMRLMEGASMIATTFAAPCYLSKIIFAITSPKATTFPYRLERALEKEVRENPACNPKGVSVRLMAMRHMEFQFWGRDEKGATVLQQEHEGLPVGLTVAKVKADSARDPSQQKITPEDLKAATLRAAARMYAEISVAEVLADGVFLYSPEWRYCVLVLTLYERLCLIFNHDDYEIGDWMLRRFHDLDSPLSHMKNPAAIEQMLRWLDQDYE